MYKVYFNDKVIIFDHNTEKYNGCNLKLFRNAEKSQLTWSAVKESLSPPIGGAAFTGDDPASLLRLFLQQFRRIKAGGGLVSDAKGHMMMISRYGKWDLPKGKLEPGESIEECARREVSEECGLELPLIVLEKPLTETLHLYCMNGEWIVKDTHWYAMRYTGDRTAVPQTEEGITETRWIDPGERADYLQNTYHTVRDVFAAAGYSSIG